MDKQPEALRLTELENMHERGTIRRGHIDEMLTELRRLHALNQELVKALKEAADAFEFASKGGGVHFYAYAKEARAAIAKAKEQT